jgi:hypothetical protein
MSMQQTPKMRRQQSRTRMHWLSKLRWLSRIVAPLFANDSNQQVFLWHTAVSRQLNLSTTDYTHIAPI